MEKPAYESAKTQPPDVIEIYLESIEQALKDYSHQNAISF